MAKKYIEADALIERVKRYCKQWSDISGDYKYGVVDAFEVFMSAIFAQPAADVVEVVRCKDCKHSAPNGVYGCTLERFSAHDKSERLYSEDYCSCGERKDG